MENNQHQHSNDDHEVEKYAEGIVSLNAPIPAWLKVNYIFWVIVGLTILCLYWNGSKGWLDRGYWNELQRAANTVYPFNTTQLVDKKSGSNSNSP